MAPVLKFSDLSLPVEAQAIQEVGDGYRLQGGHVAVQHPFSATKYYRHGFHSWSLCAWLDLAKKLAPPTQTRLWPQFDDPQLFEQDYPFNSSGVGTLQGPDGQILLLGALNLDGRVCADEQRLSGQYDGDGREWFLAYGPEEEVFSAYASHLGQRLGSRGQAAPAPRVWCSWYGLYLGIQADNILPVLEGVKGLPFEVFQLDDGWEQCIGDWEANEKFPAGMADLAGRIRQAGFTPGLWLAPFIVRPESQVYQQHPDWLLHDEAGQLVAAGENWGGPFYALDTTHPAALEWLDDLFRRLRGWGYDYLKIDFLYAAALKGKRFANLPRQQAYRMGLETVRGAIGEEAYLMVCGAPVMASLGLADGLRIGPDVAPVWDNYERSVVLQDRTGPSALNAVRTSNHRLWLRPLLHTDPDVAYFRERYNLLSRREQGLLQDLALIAGFKATSDLPQWLDPAERAALQAFLENDPMVQHTGRYTYQIDGREVDFGFIEDL